jgi:succinylglutamate desuccinylase
MKESDIQKAVCEYLERKGYFFWRQNNTPVYDPTRKVYRAMPKYALKGVPDVICFDKTKTGIAIFLEIKKPKTYQSKEQKEFETKSQDFGCEYYVIRSLDDLVKIGL